MNAFRQPPMCSARPVMLAAALTITTASAFAQAPTCPPRSAADSRQGAVGGQFNLGQPKRARHAAITDDAWDLSGERPQVPASHSSHGIDTSPTFEGQQTDLTQKD